MFLLAAPKPACAQLAFPTHPSIQFRIGAMIATPLVKDEVATSTVDDSIPVARSHGITVQQQPAPIATLALRLPVRAGTQLEVSAAAAHSAVQGDDGIATWQAPSATVGNLTIGLGYLYRHVVALRGGVGFTKLFAAQRALFAKGNSIRPLIEAGASTGVSVAGHVIELDARVQSHSFGTGTLRDNGASDGNVLRAVLQIGTTLWQAGGK